jgi:hypothetical protein
MAVTMIMVAMGMMETTVMVATGTVEANVMLEHMVLGLWVVMPEHMAMEHMVLGVAMPPKLWGTSSTTTSFVCIPVDDGNHSQLSLVTTIRLDVTETYTLTYGKDYQVSYTSPFISTYFYSYPYRKLVKKCEF